MSTPRYTHILFDHDGVLVDTEPLYFDATRRILAEMGVDLDLDHYLKLQAVGGNAWQQALDQGATQAEVAAGRARRNTLYQGMLEREPIDIDGVGDVLRALAGRLGLAIVTTARRDDFELIHRHRSIAGYMDLILTNEDYARSKPAPDPYLAALDYFGIPAHRALVVEDSQRGLAAAVAAGIHCAVVHHPFTATQDFSAATYHLPDLAALLEVAGLAPGSEAP